MEKIKALQSPWLETIIMVSAVILSFFGLFILSLIPGTASSGVMSNGTIALVLFGFFLLSVAIAAVSVIAGIGGGVIFTPIMLAFTSVNSIVVRGTGLIVAMFSGLISTGIFTRKRIANYRLCLIMTLAQGMGSLIGATLAVYTAASAGVTGEGLMRAGLGILLLGLAVYFFFGGKSLEYPKIKKIGLFTRSLKLDGSYLEESTGKEMSYQVTRAPLGIVLVLVVGLVGGFFGMGGGWAITPSLNLGMGMPLKLAAANSGVILGVGGGVSIWPYVFSGGIIPLFVLPWLAGQVIGGFIGSYALARIKVHFVRVILIGIMAFTSFGLLTKGLELLGLMGSIPAIVQVILFIVIIAAVIIASFVIARKEKNNGQ